MKFNIVCISALVHWVLIKSVITLAVHVVVLHDPLNEPRALFDTILPIFYANRKLKVILTQIEHSVLCA